MLSKLMSKVKKYMSEDSILIYQMGKVGSSSLEKAIKGSVQVHDLYYNPPCYVHRKIKYHTLYKYIMHRLSLVFKRNLFRLRRRVKIITVIRNPMERNVSMFFQSLPYWLIEYQIGISSGKGGVGARVEGESFLQDCFNEVFPHSYPLDWFDNELKKYTNIDVFQYDYDANLGYMRINKGKYEVLLVEMKSINNLSSVISDFVGADTITLSGKSNSSKQKWYSELYKPFKNKDILDVGTAKKITDSKYYKKFYCNNRLNK